MTVYAADHKKITTVFVLLLLSLLFGARTVKAETTRTVRVGYYENEVFEEGAAPGAVKTGYAYEYYRKLSEYTGWNYEYVYGSFSELYDMLLADEIDLLAGLAKREDRLAVIGYLEEPMGNETYSLVRHDDDASVNWSPSSVSGKRIGVLESAVPEVLREYLSAHAIEAEIVTFSDYEMLLRLLTTDGWISSRPRETALTAEIMPKSSVPSVLPIIISASVFCRRISLMS
ncbi:MAG: transporter substrate-binding domain-containing protein [Lachnospiraceae bacterium]|nr:transporter substrate-binding domain-containing protein [Lachnospiraceae bacterium]